MTVLEIALIILVAIWSIIFLIIGAALIMIFIAVKRAIGKANSILDKTEAVAGKVDLPSKVVIASIVGFMAKNSMGTVKKIISGFLSRK
jgi:hypothetical protein